MRSFIRRARRIWADTTRSFSSCPLWPSPARRRAPWTAALATMGAVGACREQAKAELSAPLPVAQAASMVLDVSREQGSDSLWTATLRVMDAPSSWRLGSLTASVDFDTTRVRFVADASPADQGMRAMHAERGRVRVAAIAAVGLSTDGIAQLRFATRDTVSLQSMRLAIAEAHAIDATDLRGRITVGAVRVLRVRSP